MLNEQDFQAFMRMAFPDAITGFANIVAAVAAYFVMPIAFAMTKGGIASYTYALYGDDWTGFAVVCWFIVLLALLFFAARGAVVALIKTVALKLTSRIL